MNRTPILEVEALCIIHYTNASKNLVPEAGLEPARHKREILSLLCLPFHHPGETVVPLDRIELPIDDYKSTVIPFN